MAASPHLTLELEACAIIRAVNRAGFALYVDEGKLRSYPDEGMPSELWMRLWQHKLAVGRLLMDAAR